MRRWHIQESPSALQLAEIAAALTGGAIVLMPTDTIYGLHAVATNDEAVERIMALKGREDTKPFIVLAGSVSQLSDLGISARPELLNTLQSIWPSPLTAILPLLHPIAASRGLSSLAVRIPDLPWLVNLLGRTGPLVSTSANRSGTPVTDRPSALAAEFQEQVEIVDGGVRRGEPSTILDLTADQPRFLREGDPSFAQKVWKTLWKTL